MAGMGLRFSVFQPLDQLSHQGHLTDYAAKILFMVFMNRMWNICLYWKVLVVLVVFVVLVLVLLCVSSTSVITKTLAHSDKLLPPHPTPTPNLFNRSACKTFVVRQRQVQPKMCISFCLLTKQNKSLHLVSFDH